MPKINTSAQEIEELNRFGHVPFNYSLSFNHTDSSLNVWKNGVVDLSWMVTSPVRWQGKQWGNFLLVGACAGLVYAFDEPIYKAFDPIRGEAMHRASDWFLDPIGEYQVQLGILAGLYAYGWISNKNLPRNVAILAGEAVLLTGGLTQIAKFSSGRLRPYETSPLNPKDFTAWNTQSSFWSGHTATSFALAAVFSEVYSDKMWVKITSYGLASTVGITRIVEEQHWPSDVIVGAVVGTFIGRMVTRNYKRRARAIPFISGDVSGVSLYVNF